MAIQDEMYKAIEKEINQTVESGAEKVTVNFEKAKEVAKMLTELSTSVGDGQNADRTINKCWRCRCINKSVYCQY